MTSVVGPGVGSRRRPSWRGFEGTNENDTYFVGKSRMEVTETAEFTNEGTG
jgi:hypothetical protein